MSNVAKMQCFLKNHLQTNGNIDPRRPAKHMPKCNRSLVFVKIGKFGFPEFVKGV